LYERAFRIIETVVHHEIHPAAKARQTAPELRAAEYFDRVAPAAMCESMRLLARLDEVGDESMHLITQALFAAAVSGLSDGIERLRGREYFAHVATAEPQTFLAEINGLTEEDWARDVRHNIPVQRETRAISLVTRTARTGDRRHNQYVRQVDSYAARLPGLMAWLLEFAATAGGGMLQLARVVNLRAGGQVYRHIDRGLYYMIRDRYHLVLSSSGSRMKCEDQVSIWAPGEVWWFNNHIPHQAFNDGDTERVHVIFDILPHDARVLAPYFQICSDYAAASSSFQGGAHSR
jgi:hypothetical protein